ncbi:hypothetical protein LC607_18420 [Nostoc sp. CHAB 5824]|nr:hypothetical protein [Nostoc sp. CHAB 5824]
MSDSLHRYVFAGKDLSVASSQAIAEADVLMTSTSKPSPTAAQFGS